LILCGGKAAADILKRGGHDLDIEERDKHAHAHHDKGHKAPEPIA
jgi:hypothetical protein